MEDNDTSPTPSPFRRRYRDVDEPRRGTSGLFPLWLAVILIGGAGIYIVRYGTEVLDQYSSLLAKLESDRQADRETLANLRQQLEKTSQDVTLLAGGRLPEVSRARETDTDEPPNNNNSSDPKKPSASPGEHRVDFELGVNHNKELAPGVSLLVSHTDIGRQRYDGLLSVEPDKRTWVHDQAIQQLVVFFSGRDQRPGKLVVTRVTKYSVIGYVLVPNGRDQVGRSGAD